MYFGFRNITIRFGKKTVLENLKIGAYLRRDKAETDPGQPV